jgi:hypothetical protein
MSASISGSRRSASSRSRATPGRCHARAGLACTLDEVELEDRTTKLSELAARALTGRTPIDGQRLFFADSPALERELRAAIDAEATCCSFLAMRLARTDGALVLDVTGPAQAAPIIDGLFA